MDAALVGRDDELDALGRWLDEARAGAPRVVLVDGEAGIGKTRLADELTHRAEGSGVVVAWGRGTEQEGAPAFWPWRQVLDRLGHGDVLSADPTAEPEVERFARFVRATTVLGGAAEGDGLLVVLDDVHQVDRDTLRLLVHVAATLAGPVLLLITHRSSPADHVDGFAASLDELQRLPHTRRLSLTDLDAGAVAELLGLDGSDPLLTRATERCGGNPLLIGELARHLRAGLDPGAVPASVRDAVGARLAARSPSCVQALQVASVVGREFDAGLVATVTGEPAMSVLEALEEAQAAGLVEPSDPPGRYRFVHVLVRDAVEASLGAGERPAVHRRIAEAIEVYGGVGDDALPELARHWSAAAALGDREVAATWCERAAASADRRTAWAEAARLYDRAAELTAGTSDPDARHRRLLGSARARLHSDDIQGSVDRAMAAAGEARRLGRADLLAESCLLAEGRGGSPEVLLRLHSTAEEALAALAPDDHALRARVLGQLTTTAFYVDPSEVEAISLRATEEAEASADPLATVAAARARQMALTVPHHAETRLELAAHLGAAGRELGRPTITQWESIWRIDAFLELGRIDDARAELVELRRRVAAIGLPMSLWHQARAEALLAHASGRFAESVEWSERARQLFAALEDPLGAIAIHQAFLLTVQRHVGFDRGLVHDIHDFDYSLAPPFLGDLPALAPIQALIGGGDLDAAASRYALLAPPDQWSAPPFLLFTMTVLRTMVAATLGRTDDLPTLVAVLEQHRGLHAGASAGGFNYLGCTELWLGVGRAALGELDAAIADLRVALETTIANSTRPITVETATVLAEVLIERAAPGDVEEARELAARWHTDAAALGMVPWITRLDAVLAAGAPTGAAGPGAGPLSPRELEVAALVARGLTNKQIASELFLSERTAQNHVQHILTKLGLANRTQIAAWFNQR